MWDTSQLLLNGSISVGAVPAVSVIPPTTNIAYGSSVTLTALVSGTQTFQYQWYDNATNLIAGATNQTLTLARPPVTGSGNYAVVVTNIYGKATNSAFVRVSLLHFLSCAPGSNQAFVLGGSGPDGSSCRILSSTNLILPLTNWTPMITGIFSGGQFWFTDTLATNILQRFYQISVP